MNLYEITPKEGPIFYYSAAAFEFVSDGEVAFWVFLDDEDNNIAAVKAKSITRITCEGEQTPDSLTQLETNEPKEEPDQDNDDDDE